MTLSDVMARERGALMSEYLFRIGTAQIQVPPYCAVADFTDLRQTPSLLRSVHPVSIDELPGSKKPGQAFVQSCASLGYQFLWAHVDNDSYREDYLTFLRTRQKLTIDALPANVHVDHLYSRARARALSLRYIRMVLLPAAVNTSHGAGYEKSRTQGGIGTPGNPRGLDEVMLLKLWGIASPRKGQSLTPEIQQHALRMAAAFGLPPAEIERNISELMDVASFRPERGQP